MKLIVWMIRENLKMLDQYVVDNPTLPVNQRFSHLFKILAECQAILWECRAATMGRQAIWDTHGISGNVFFSNPTASSSAPYPQESNLWISNVSEHTSPHVMSESQAPNTALDPRCQSGPSARTSQSSLVRENFQRIMEQTNNDCRFQILILTNSPRQPRSLVGR